jgi:hypothetical protein
MPIPESQLETWSHQGSITNSAATGNSVKTAIEQYDKFPERISFEVYLQGSYKNDTNIYGDSDVDVTIELKSSFYSNLTEEQKGIFNFTKANYDFFNFRDDVETCLRTYYQTRNIKSENKVFKIAPNTNRLDADVLVCFTYRFYYNVSNENNFHKGISFYTRNEGREIINFPKRHSDNATTKHQSTSQWFKPTVRIFKNMRNYLVNNNGFNKDLAPSYFIECILSNIPNNQFGVSYETTVINCINYLIKNDNSNFKCLNGLRPLWGVTDENWNKSDANNFLVALINLWKNW